MLKHLIFPYATHEQGNVDVKHDHITVSEDPVEYHYFFKSKLGQWSPSPFRDNHFIYTCAEQFMMAKKAILFKDREAHGRIMDSVDPREQKNLGRKVKNFDLELWKHNRCRIVVKGNLLKFMQNPEHAKILLDTYPKILVEASPYDKVWGIGINEEAARNTHPSEWMGLNLLGQCLMEVRAILIRCYGIVQKDGCLYTEEGDL